MVRNEHIRNNPGMFAFGILLLLWIPNAAVSQCHTDNSVFYLDEKRTVSYLLQLDTVCSTYIFSRHARKTISVDTGHYQVKRKRLSLTTETRRNSFNYFIRSREKYFIRDHKIYKSRWKLAFKKSLQDTASRMDLSIAYDLGPCPPLKIAKGKNGPLKPPISEKPLASVMSLPLTKENVYRAIRHYKIDSAHRVWQQVMVESAHLTSGNVRQYNNLLGMKYPRVRETTATGRSASGYAIYKYWTDSIKDYKLWQAMSAVDTEYHRYLRRRNYAEDRRYEKICKSVRLPDYIAEVN